VESYCGQVEGLVYDIAHPVFSLVQLYFIFKFGNVIVNKNRWLARFAFAHCISASVSFWMYTLINETLDALVQKFFPKEIGYQKYDVIDECSYSGIMTSTTLHSTTSTEPDTVLSSISSQANYAWAACDPEGSGLYNNMICVVGGRALFFLS
jgi:hypothetical protein